MNPRMRVTNDGQNISVSLQTGVLRVSVVEASWMEAEQEWWIARALVNPPEIRSRGTGSKLLRRLIEEIGKGKRIVVAPGGYELNPERQYNFYEKNGFKRVTHDGVTVLEMET